MGKLKVGVVGVGHLGKIHARVYSELPSVALVGVADIDEQSARVTADKYYCEAYTNYREMIDRVDAVSVVVPTDLHFKVASDFIRAGKHVIVEKPMTLKLQEARDLVALSAEHNVIMQVGHVERFNPAVVAVQEYIDVPRFIECDRISPFSFRSMDVGVVLDMMIHDIDIVLAFVDSPVEEIDAMGVSVVGSHEDMANARILFGNGCIANLRASRISRKTMRKIRIFQEDTYVSLNYGTHKAQIFKKTGEFKPEMLLEFKQNAPSIKDAQEMMFEKLLTIREIDIVFEEPLKKELESFVHSIETGTAPVVPGELGVKTMQIAAHILDSIRTHKRVYPGE
jgi:predicted dehydrogenase